MAIRITPEEERDHILILDVYGFEKILPVTKRFFREVCEEGSVKYAIVERLQMFIDNGEPPTGERNPHKYIEFERTAAQELWNGITAQRFEVKTFIYTQKE